MKVGNIFEKVEKIVKNFKLRAKKLETEEDARIAVMKGRQCICYFWLFPDEMDKFKEFFTNEKTKKGILKKEDILNPNNNKDGDVKEIKGHVVVLISIEENCLKFLNSYGNGWGDNGYFRILNKKALRQLQFIEIFWEKSDLTQEEKDKYNNYLLFIKHASNYLSQPNLDIKNDLEKEIECPIPTCKKKSLLNKFELIFEKLDEDEAKNEIKTESKICNNDLVNEDNDKRKIIIKCPNCNNTFESDEVATKIYLYNILN